MGIERNLSKVFLLIAYSVTIAQLTYIYFHCGLFIFSPRL